LRTGLLLTMRGPNSETSGAECVCQQMNSQ
jgi:hypothetical protein